MTDRVIKVTVDSTGVTRGANNARRQLTGLERASSGVASGFRAAAGAAAAFGLALGVREVIQAADAYQSLQNQLRVVTSSQDELAAVQQRLFTISQETRGSFEATTELYSRAAIAAGELGASQEELLRLTEISGKALAIQGSSAAEASGALRQLSQAFSSGIVRAEEFNSILEGAFPLAQAAARGIDEAGGSVGRLRQLVAEGQITSREFFEGIQAGAGEIDEAFANTEVTLSQAAQLISNSFLNLVGQVNEVSGAGSGLADILVEVSGFLDDLTLAVTGTLQPSDEISDNLKVFASVAIAGGAAARGLADIIDATLVESFKALGEIIGATAAGIVALLSGEFGRVGDIFGQLGESLADRFNASVETLNQDLIANIEDTTGRLTEIWDATTRDIIEQTELANNATKETPPVDPAALETLTDATSAVDDFLQALNEQTAQLAIQAGTQGDATEALTQYRENLAIATAEQEIFGDAVPTPELEALRQKFLEFAGDAIQAQRDLREEIANEEIRQSFDEQIAALEEEIFLLNADTEAIAANAEARALAGGATLEQAARIRELTAELERERIASDEATDNFTAFLEDASGAAEDQLSGILADPLSAGLDELPFKFAQTLQELAAQALAAEVFDILGSLGGGGAGGGGGDLVGSLIGSFFGGGFQAGGQVRGGQPILVGERGPELFTPPSSGAIQPNININQAAQAAPTVMVTNVTDPADVPTGLNTAEGQEAVINIIQRNPEAVKRVLG